MALPDENPRAAAAVAVKAGADAVIDALAAVDAVEAGKAIAQEKARLVEFEALAVLVRDSSGIAAVGRRREHRHRLDDLTVVLAAAHPRIAPGERHLRENPAGERARHCRAAGDRQVVRMIAVAAQ